MDLLLGTVIFYLFPRKFSERLKVLLHQYFKGARLIYCNLYSIIVIMGMIYVFNMSLDTYRWNIGIPDHK